MTRLLMTWNNRTQGLVKLGRETVFFLNISGLTRPELKFCDRRIQTRPDARLKFYHKKMKLARLIWYARCLWCCPAEVYWLLFTQVRTLIPVYYYLRTNSVVCRIYSINLQLMSVALFTDDGIAVTLCYFQCVSNHRQLHCLLRIFSGQQ